jgi:seryl-tRNA synthetase
MLDISLLRKDLAQVVARLETRQSPQSYLDVARFSALEGERKALQTRTEELQAKRNVQSREIGKLTGQGADASAAMADVAAIGAELDRSAERLAAIQLELNDQLMSLPNLPDASVPVGADEHANVEVRRLGVPR